jgi:hypothetical protein
MRFPDIPPAYDDRKMCRRTSVFHPKSYQQSAPKPKTRRREDENILDCIGRIDIGLVDNVLCHSLDALSTRLSESGAVCQKEHGEVKGRG